MMVKVDSTMLNAIGYDDKTRTLTVEFNDGVQYQYLNVTRGVYDKLVVSKSKGGAFTELVKHGGYRYRKVGEKG